MPIPSMAGAAPIEVTAGQTQHRHRLSRRGDRQLNKALHQVAVTRFRCHQPTQAYKARPTGKSSAASHATAPDESFGYLNTTHHPKPPLADIEASSRAQGLESSHRPSSSSIASMISSRFSAEPLATAGVVRISTGVPCR